VSFRQGLRIDLDRLHTALPLWESILRWSAAIHTLDEFRALLLIGAGGRFITDCPSRYDPGRLCRLVSVFVGGAWRFAVVHQPTANPNPGLSANPVAFVADGGICHPTHHKMRGQNCPAAAGKRAPTTRPIEMDAAGVLQRDRGNLDRAILVVNGRTAWHAETVQVV